MARFLGQTGLENNTPLIFIDILDRFINRLQSARATSTQVLVLLPLLVLQFWPSTFNGNEVHYFNLAYNQISPDGVMPHSAAFDNSKARFVSEVLLGYPVSWFGYEAAHAIFRIATAIGFAAVIGYFFSALGLSAAAAAIVLGLNLLIGNALMGGEWIFQGVESKTLAYIFVFLALGAILRGRRVLTIVCLVCATYLHFLVGGFWLLAILALDAFYGWDAKRTLKMLGGYLVAMGPLAAVIAYEQLVALKGSPAAASGLSADYIYSILRLPHHVAPFASISQLHGWARGISTAFALTLAVAVLLRNVDRERKPAFRWLLALLLYLFAALVVSAFDAKTGALGKFYLFRPAALSLFLATAFIAAYIEPQIDGSAKLRVLGKGLLIFIIPLVVLRIADQRLTEQFGGRHQIQLELLRAADFIRDTTEPRDIVLVDPANETGLNNGAEVIYFGRPTLVSWKFVPSNPYDIQRWYELIQYRARVFGGECEALARYPVRYLLLDRRKRHGAPPCGNVVWQGKFYSLADVFGDSDAPRRPASP